ncbi:hypothetical protein AGDE_13109 [Angomonas deanei]|uniref:Uncharacterized protein n=1 Tax=Angomonas deanei TaxID=59799 RepID=A0A7G2CHT8_9TRYP|nr:hypothetical protein AGDE_13109 [Angomonas deanei]CAD2218531.1 hypothetical protein, conserved [Angomonas deanei]|eukprot:EPY22715.1 hypothetical protein AGDE_13109 [Angomonas deanei]
MTNRCAKRQYSSGHSFLSLSVRRNTINNQNKLCVPVRWNSSQAEGRSDGKEENDNTVPYSVDDHVAEAESHLKNQFGPYAKIVVHKLYNQPQHHQKSNNSNTDDGEEEQGASSLQTEGNTSSAPQNVYYRVSATFKLLGFPIELAATKGHKVKETIEACLYQALSSDIEFIHPSSGNNNHTHRNTLTPYQQELKAILTELKGHCQFLSRSLKFSVKPPHAEILQQRGQRGSAGGATPEAEPEAPQEEEEDVNRRLWRCRVYLKDEWGLTNRMVLDQEYYGDSPRLALAKSVSSLRDKFAKEVERYNTQPIGLREVRRLLLKCYEGSRRSEATLQCRQEENREDGEEASSSDVVRYTENHEEDETLPNYKIREKNIREKRMQKQKELYTQRAQRPASTKFSLFSTFGRN